MFGRICIILSFSNRAKTTTTYFTSIEDVTNCCCLSVDLYQLKPIKKTDLPPDGLAMIRNDTASKSEYRQRQLIISVT